MVAFLAWLACLCLGARALVQRKQLARGRLLAYVGVALALAVLAVLAGPSGLVLQKVIARLVMPAAWIWDAAWLVVILGVAHARRRWIVSGAALGVVATLAGNEPLGQAMNRYLERDYQGDPFGQGTFDAVFVLGGGVDLAPHSHYELGPSGDRIALAARLYHRGLAKSLVISGTVIEGLQETFDNVGATAEILGDLGVPADAIVRQVGATRNTREEAAGAARLVRERGWTRVAVLTSAWHMRRARALFDKAGVHAVPLAADHRGDLRWEGLYSVIPRDSGYYLVSKASWELLGAAVGF